MSRTISATDTTDRIFTGLNVRGNGSFTVPTGATKMRLTGVAAGGSQQRLGPYTLYDARWQVDTSYAGAVSPNGVYAVGRILDLTGSQYYGFIYSPLTKKLNITPFYSSSFNATAHRVTDAGNWYLANSGKIYKYKIGADSQLISTGRSCNTDDNNPFVIKAVTGGDRLFSVVSGTAIEYGFMADGTTKAASDTVSTTYAGYTHAGVKEVNGHIVCLTKTSTTTNILYAANTVTTTAGWTNVQIDSSSINLYDISYANGLYVITGNAQKCWTATSLDGPWTARTLTTNQTWFSAGGHDGTRYVIGGYNRVAYSTDGATWTEVVLSATAAAGIGAPKHLFYNTSDSTWYAAGQMSADGKAYHYSTDGVSWTAVPITSTYQRSFPIPVRGGVLWMYSGGSASAVTASVSSRATNTSIDMYNDGGATMVVDSAYAEVLRLAGGSWTTTDGYGGNSFGTNTTAAAGMFGTGGSDALGAANYVVPPTGNAGSGYSTNLLGGGGTLMIHQIPESAYGIKIPGGNTGATSYAGGGSMLAQGGMKGNPAVGPGGGGVSGGGGEGICRFDVPVTAGETYHYNCGMNNYISSNFGILRVEFE